MLTIAIQAGGESRRMGQDKALLPFLGQPLIQRVLSRVVPLADEILVITNRPAAYRFLGVPLLSDHLPGHGPLGGFYTALSAATQPLVAILACDMPFVNPALLAYERDVLLSEQVDAVIPLTDRGREPFHGIYRRQACLPPVKAALESDLWRADSWFDQVRLRLITDDEILRYDPKKLSFMNLNTPEQLQAALQIAIEEESKQP